MKGFTKVGTLLALIGGATICAAIAQPAQAHDRHWYREQAANQYWHEQRWLANHASYNNGYYYSPYSAPVYVQQAPMVRRRIIF